MSIFSRLGKNIKRAINTVAPLIGVAAPFIPGVGPIIGGVIAAVGGSAASARTPGIAPPTAMPGSGQILESRVRRPAATGPSQEFIRRTGMTKPAQVFNPAPVGQSRPVPPGGGVKTIMPVAGPPPVHIPAAVPRPVIQLPPVSQQRTQQMSIFAALPAIGAAGRAAAPAIGRAAGTIFRGATGRAATAAGLGVALGASLGGGSAGACPSGWHLNKQDGVGGAAGTYCVRNRRMNVGNARAARRSVRRLKGARKLLRDIEKMMPSKPRPRARAPAGHAAHLHHTGS